VQIRHTNASETQSVSMNASYLIWMKVFVLEKLFIKILKFIAALNVQLYYLPNRTSMYRLSK